MRLLQTHTDVVRALRDVAGALPASTPPATIVLAGASAAILGHLLGRGRSTTDCDVMRAEPEEAWAPLAKAAAVVGRRLGLRADWLSRDCQMYAWSLPLGWRERCEHVAKLGALDVWRLSRLDLICAKIMSAPRRPQDMEDLRAMEPEASDLEFATANLDRLSAESLDNEGFDDQRRVIADLRKELDEEQG
jgi:hypothetical protein